MNIPTATAVNRSVATMRSELASHAPALRLESFTRPGISPQWLIVQTLARRIPEITGSGMDGTRGTARKKNTSRKTACSIPAAGVWPPPRTFVDV